MTPEQIEKHLLDRMTGSHLRTPDAGNLRETGPQDFVLENIVAIGLDTNVVKQLGRDTIFANKLVSALDANSVALIVPAQTVIEFWNRYKTFASEDATKIINEVSKLRNVLDKMGALSLAEDRLDMMQKLVEDITQEVKEATTAEYLEKSRLMMELLLRDATQPMVSRLQFAAIATSRQGCKVPPGFADDAKKGSAGLGDFYVWCDFLMGALAQDAGANGTFLFATDDAKADWKTGNVSHPELSYEFQRLTSGQLVVASYQELRQLIERGTSRAKSTETTGTSEESEL